jgi:gag-polypeptide of LTR copia-type
MFAMSASKVSYKGFTITLLSGVDESFRGWQRAAASWVKRNGGDAQHKALTERIVLVAPDSLPEGDARDKLVENNRDARAAWDAADEAACTLLLSLMEDDLQNHYDDLTSAYELWNKLDAQYATFVQFNASNLEKRLSMMSPTSSESAADFCRRVIAAARKLQTASVVANTSETFVRGIILKNLELARPQWGRFMPTLKFAAGESVTLENLASALTRFEADEEDLQPGAIGGVPREGVKQPWEMALAAVTEKMEAGFKELRGSGGGRGAGRSGRPRCWNCGELGHIR